MTIDLGRLWITCRKAIHYKIEVISNIEYSFKLTIVFIKDSV